jgi:Uma2 family endonuclease
MVAAVPLHFPLPPPARRPSRGAAAIDRAESDQRLVIEGVSWRSYVALNDSLDQHPGVRVCYCEGTLELMSPSFLHEDKKKSIARLLELWSLANDVPLHGLGSMTYRRKAKKRGAEPDECYFVGKAARGKAPHIAIEVATSRSAIDKFSLYAGLGVRELWIWEDYELRIFHLVRSTYREIERSRLLPSLDLDELSSFVRRPDQAAAAKAYWKHLSQAAR